MDRTRPLIAVTGPNRRISWSWWASALSIRLAGGRPVRLTSANYKAHGLDRLQGVVIGGGDDIHPELYGGEDTGKVKLDPARDSFELDVIEHAMDTHLPILGICRGAQLINVMLGGSLHQDIRTMRRFTSNRRTLLPLKTACSARQGRLFELMKAERWKINSLHHQAIDRLGDGLAIAAHDLDGLVQAVETNQGRFILGVQWHPEYLFYFPRQLCIFRVLIKHARQVTPEPLNV